MSKKNDILEAWIMVEHLSEGTINLKDKTIGRFDRVQDGNYYGLFSREISAFSNYDGGEIYFGINDNGGIKGLSDVKQACLNIGNEAFASADILPIMK